MSEVYWRPEPAEAKWDDPHVLPISSVPMANPRSADVLVERMGLKSPQQRALARRVLEEVRSPFERYRVAYFVKRLAQGRIDADGNYLPRDFALEVEG